MARTRAFEMKLLSLFSEGKLYGTTHTYIGQEACAAALYTHVDPARDAVFTNHRCHGHYLAYGGSMAALMAEIMGKVGGVCSSRGGSQHLCDGRFFSQGVQGGGMPIAAGYAFGIKRAQTGGMVVAHIGDGTLGEGLVYETLNLASILSVPLLVVLEHNHVAQSTDTKTTLAGDVEARFSAFGIDVDRRPAHDPADLSDHLAGVVSHVREGHPFVQIFDTFRLMAHSKGDDDRPPELIERAWKEDFLAQLLESGDPQAVSAWESARAEVEAVATSLEAEPFATLGETAVFAEPEGGLFESSSELVAAGRAQESGIRVNDLLSRALGRCLDESEDVLLLGEDIVDPYGGAFKATRGLSTKHPDRVLSTPISEAAIVGFGNGFALGGGRPVVEIMFGDFVTLAADQIINQAAKAHFMYDAKASVPVTIRLPSGGYRGYGPTHSQSLESLFCGVPGLKVVALSRRHDPQVLVEAAVLRDPNPVLFVENKLLYALRPHHRDPDGFRFVPTTPADSGSYPSLAYSSVGDDEAADVTVVTYGGLTDMVEEALEDLILREEVEFEYFVLTQLSPLNVADIVASVGRTGRLVTVEEGPAEFGVGSGVVSAVAAALPGRALRTACVGARPLPIPNSRQLEREVLPSSASVVEAISTLV
jgi:2-oxoisovalerate dehydrogenase E1 component